MMASVGLCFYATFVVTPDESRFSSSISMQNCLVLGVLELSAGTEHPPNNVFEAIIDCSLLRLNMRFDKPVSITREEHLPFK